MNTIGAKNRPVTGLLSPPSLNAATAISTKSSIVQIRNASSRQRDSMIQRHGSMNARSPPSSPTTQATMNSVWSALPPVVRA